MKVTGDLFVKTERIVEYTLTLKMRTVKSEEVASANQFRLTTMKIKVKFSPVPL